MRERERERERKRERERERDRESLVQYHTRIWSVRWKGNRKE